MICWSVTLLVVVLVTFGFELTGVAATAGHLARILLVLFGISFAVLLVFGLVRRPAVNEGP